MKFCFYFVPKERYSEGSHPKQRFGLSIDKMVNDQLPSGNDDSPHLATNYPPVIECGHWEIPHL
jgi:hypothetical protein